jgi:hypothetical protein
MATSGVGDASTVKSSNRRLMAAFVGITASCLVGVLVLAAAVTRSCLVPSASRQGQVAAEFARALASNHYDQAHSFLSASLGSMTPVAALRREYEAMTGYGGGPATDVRVIIVLDYWPDKLPGDIGWAYAAISGVGFSEAVTVIVARENGKAVIRQLEWGRP